MADAPTPSRPQPTGRVVPTPGGTPAPAEAYVLRRNLDSSFHPRASRAATVLVLVGGGLAMALRRQRDRRAPGLVGLALLLVIGHLAEAELVAQLLPRLLP